MTSAPAHESAAESGGVPFPEFKFVGFTGHRDLANPAAVRRGLAEALQQVQARGGGAEWIAVSSVAAGADTEFVTQACAAGLAWHAVLPLPVHTFREDFSVEAWAHAEALLVQAEDTFVVPTTETRNEAYLDAGLETVDRADVLIAVWDGKPSRGQGGTAEVLQYAREINRPVLVVDPVTGAVQGADLSALDRPDPLVAEINALPTATSVISAEAGATDRPEALVQFWQKADMAATEGAPHFRRMVGGTVILHVTATLVAVAAIVFHWHAVALPWLKLACLVGAVVVAVKLARSHAHHRWLRQRVTAEVCRSALGAWGLHGEMGFLNTIRVPELGPLVRSLRVLHLRGRGRRTKPLDAFKEGYLIARIERQASYFRRQELSAAPLLRWLRLGFWSATWAAIVCTAAYAITATLGATDEIAVTIKDVVFYLLPVCLPVVAAGSLSFVSINDLQRRVAGFRDMQALLLRSRKQLKATHSWNAVSKVVTTTEQGLLHEVLEWHAIARYAESH